MRGYVKKTDEEPEFAFPHPLATLVCLGGIGYALPAIAWRPDLLPPADFAFGFGEFLQLLAEDYRVVDSDALIKSAVLFS